jgi:PAS domain-containing protein
MGEGRELFARRRHGIEFPVEVGLRPMETTDGRMTVACVIDVSARRPMEDSFRTIVDAAPNGMLMTDVQGKITMANQNLCAMFGYEKVELHGQPIEMLLRERHRIDPIPLRDGFSTSPSKLFRFAIRYCSFSSVVSDGWGSRHVRFSGIST